MQRQFGMKNPNNMVASHRSTRGQYGAAGIRVRQVTSRVRGGGSRRDFRGAVVLYHRSFLRAGSGCVRSQHHRRCRVRQLSQRHQHGAQGGFGPRPHCDCRGSVRCMPYAVNHFAIQQMDRSQGGARSRGEGRVRAAACRFRSSVHRFPPDRRSLVSDLRVLPHHWCIPRNTHPVCSLPRNGRHRGHHQVTGSYRNQRSLRYLPYHYFMVQSGNFQSQ